MPRLRKSSGRRAKKAPRKRNPQGPQRRASTPRPVAGPQSSRKLSIQPVPAPVAFGRVVNFAAGTGMADLIRHRFQYQAGYIYVGNGTIGVNDSVYFMTSSTADVVLGFVPILPADSTNFGQTYIGDVFKHYMRRVYHSIKLHIIPIAVGNNTNSGVDIIVAPVRSGDFVPTLSTTTDPANDPAGVIGMSGAVQFTVWCGASYDLTPYIAGGSGAKQNEFNIASSVTTGSETTTTDSLLVPCGFAIAGDAVATTFRGVRLARVYIEIVVSLLDFTGGFTANDVQLTRLREARMKKEIDAKHAKEDQRPRQRLQEDYIPIEMQPPQLVAEPSSVRLSRQTIVVPDRAESARPFPSRG